MLVAQFATYEAFCSRFPADHDESKSPNLFES